MSASRGMTRMTDAVPGKPGTAGNEDISYQAGQNPPGRAGVRDLLGDEVLDALWSGRETLTAGCGLPARGPCSGTWSKLFSSVPWKVSCPRTWVTVSTIRRELDTAYPGRIK